MDGIMPCRYIVTKKRVFICWCFKRFDFFWTRVLIQRFDEFVTWGVIFMHYLQQLQLIMVMPINLQMHQGILVIIPWMIWVLKMT